MEPVSVLKTWQRVSALLGDLHTCAWLTTSDWAKLATEINGLTEDQGANLVKATNATFKQCYVGKNLLLRKSGTDDRGVVNAMNWFEIGDKFEQFDYRRRAWQVGNTFSPHDLNLKDDPLNE